MLDYILKEIFHFPIPMKHEAVRTLMNLCRGYPLPKWEKVKKIIKPLTKLLKQSRDYETIIGILWCLSHLSESRIDMFEVMEYGLYFQISPILETGVVKYIIDLIKHSIRMSSDAFNVIGKTNYNTSNISRNIQQQLKTSDFLIAPCVSILCNIVSGTNEHVEKVVESGFYDIIEACIEHRISVFRQISCVSLNNVVVGALNQLHLFFRKSLVNKVVGLALNDNITVRKEAGFCLESVSYYATFEQVRMLVKCRFLEAMIGLLSFQNLQEIIRIGIDGLDNCMRVYKKYQEEKSNDYKLLLEKIQELGGLDRLKEKIQELDGLDRLKVIQLVSKF